MRTRLFYLLGPTMALAMVVLTPMVTRMLAQDPANTAKKSAPRNPNKNVPKSASGGESEGAGSALGGLGGLEGASGGLGDAKSRSGGISRPSAGGVGPGNTGARAIRGSSGMSGGLSGGLSGGPSGAGVSGMAGMGGSMPGGGGGMSGMPGGGGAMMGSGMSMPGMSEDAELEGEVENLTAMYAESEEPEEREQLRTQLADVLEQIFDARHQRRLQELEALEARVSKFRSIIEARQAQRSEIVKGRLDMIVREADGLGWGDGAARQPGR